LRFEPRAVALLVVDDAVGPRPSQRLLQLVGEVLAPVGGTVGARDRRRGLIVEAVVPLPR
jgi:hypothetical protein